MTKAENSRVAQSNEPSAHRIAADLSLAGELARMTAMFQQRAIIAHMGFNPALNTPPATFTPDHGGGCDAQAASNVNAVPDGVQHIAAKPENAEPICTHCGEPAPHCQHSDALFAGVVA